MITKTDDPSLTHFDLVATFCLYSGVIPNERLPHPIIPQEVTPFLNTALYITMYTTNLSKTTWPLFKDYSLLIFRELAPLIKTVSNATQSDR